VTSDSQGLVGATSETRIKSERLVPDPSFVTASSTCIVFISQYSQNLGCCTMCFSLVQSATFAGVGFLTAGLLYLSGRPRKYVVLPAFLALMEVSPCRRCYLTTVLLPSTEYCTAIKGSQCNSCVCCLMRSRTLLSTVCVARIGCAHPSGSHHTSMYSSSSILKLPATHEVHMTGLAPGTSTPSPNAYSASFSS
jgi:hypothetical protein